MPYFAALVFSVLVFASIHNPTHAPFSTAPRALDGDGLPFLGWSTFSNLTLTGTDLTRYIAVSPENFSIALPNFLHAGIGGGQNLLFVPQSWTLLVELQFYLLAPLLVRLPVRWLGALTAALLLNRMIFYEGLRARGSPFDDAAIFPLQLQYFLLGSLAYHLFRAFRGATLSPRFLRALAAVAPNAAIAVVLLGLHLLYNADRRGYDVFYVCFAALVPLAFYLTKNWRWDGRIGDYSYPIYLFHFAVKRAAVRRGQARPVDVRQVAGRDGAARHAGGLRDLRRADRPACAARPQGDRRALGPADRPSGRDRGATAGRDPAHHRLSRGLGAQLYTRSAVPFRCARSAGARADPRRQAEHERHEPHALLLQPHRIMRAARSSQHLARRALALGYTGAAETHRLRTDRAWRDEIKRASRAKGPVVVGPWISEVGFEVLYWLPLLNRILEDSAVRPADVTIVTRGGAHCWYRDVGHNQLELFDLFSPDELRQFNERRVRETGGQKQMGRTSLDIEVVRRAGDRLPIEAALIHPSLMYNAFRSLWSWRVPPKAVLADMRFRTLPDPGRPDIAARLPDEYVAVKAYHSSCFPPTPENRAFVAALLERLSARTNVVLLSTGLRVDDHDEVEVGGGEVIDAQGWMTPRDNLEVQTQIIRGTSCLFSSYGGFSYLGPFLGVPSVCFWSRANFNSTHFELMRQAVHALGAPPFVALDTADVELLEAALVAPADVAARR